MWIKEKGPSRQDIASMERHNIKQFKDYSRFIRN